MYGRKSDVPFFLPGTNFGSERHTLIASLSKIGSMERKTLISLTSPWGDLISFTITRGD